MTRIDGARKNASSRLLGSEEYSYLFARFEAEVLIFSTPCAYGSANLRNTQRKIERLSEVGCDALNNANYNSIRATHNNIQPKFCGS